ncbi:unnamed protein product [Dicrocoelium dendriticum]|nr:unnamed protein product [Dicrocoelium dendriticum]
MNSETTLVSSWEGDFFIPELEHPNYRSLDWGLEDLKIPRNTGQRVRVHNTSVTKSELCKLEEPSLSSEHIRQLGLHYRIKDAVSMCYIRNPILKQFPVLETLQEKLQSLTGKPRVTLNDYRYMESLKARLLEDERAKKVRKDGDRIETPAIAVSRPFTLRSRSQMGIYRVLSPYLPKPYNMDYSYTGRKGSHWSHVSKTDPGKTFDVNRDLAYRDLSREQYELAMKELFFGPRGNSAEPVVVTFKRVLPNQENEIITMYDLAARALAMPNTYAKQKRKIRVK